MPRKDYKYMQRRPDDLLDALPLRFFFNVEETQSFTSFKL